jgi:hypothetical protein
MKKLLAQLVAVGSVCLLATSVSIAADAMPANAKTWVCTTNASSAESGSAANNADQEMKKAKSATAAFEFAYNNCRDCTKITCKAQ